MEKEKYDDEMSGACKRRKSLENIFKINPVNFFFLERIVRVGGISKENKCKIVPCTFPFSL